MRNRSRWIALAALLVCLATGYLAEPPAPAPAAPQPPPANGLVALLTDYGSADPYVGILKGVILSAEPEVRIVDLGHDVPNFDVASASYQLGRIAADWPPGTTFIVVVDPGVGTPRERIAVSTWPLGQVFVGPDNGVFTDVIAAAERVEVRRLENAALARPGAASSTFHGRDWFGPVGAHLAAGTPFEAVGGALGGALLLPRPAARRQGSTLVGTVIYVDHYGNLLTNIPRALAEAAGVQVGRTVRLRVGRGPWAAANVARTYGEVPEGTLLVTVHNAPEQLEVAVNLGSAAARLGARGGVPIELTVEPGR